MLHHAPTQIHGSMHQTAPSEMYNRDGDNAREIVSDNCSDSSYGQASGSSSGYGSNVQNEVDMRPGTNGDQRVNQHRLSTSTFQRPQEFKEPQYPGVVLRHHGVHYQASTPCSSISSPSDPRDQCHMSMTSLDSGWSSNNIPLSSFTSHTSASSLNSDKPSNDDLDHTRSSVSSFKQKRHSTMSQGHPAPVPPPQRSSSIRASFRGSSESVSSSRCSQSDIYRPSSNHQRRYSSSSSISSSRNGEDSICSMDIRQMISQGKVFFISRYIMLHAL